MNTLKSSTTNEGFEISQYLFASFAKITSNYIGFVDSNEACNLNINKTLIWKIFLDCIVDLVASSYYSRICIFQHIAIAYTTMSIKLFILSAWDRLYKLKENQARSITWIIFLHSFLSNNMFSFNPVTSKSFWGYDVWGDKEKVSYLSFLERYVSDETLSLPQFEI